MSTSLDVYDPKFDSIFHDAIEQAYDEIIKNRSKTPKKTKRDGADSTNSAQEKEIRSEILNKDHSLAFRQKIITGVSKRLEDHFKEQNRQQILTTEQLRLIEKSCLQKLTELKNKHLTQNQNKNKEITFTKKDKSNLNKFVTAMLFVVALKYSTSIMARIKAIKNLKQKQLQAAYIKWKRRKIRQIREREMEKRAQEEATSQDPATLAEQERKRDEAYKAEVRLLWGDLFDPERRANLSDDASIELAAIIAAEDLGDHVHDTISTLHKELNLPEMHPEDMAQFKNEVEGFKQALFEIDTSLTRKIPDKTPGTGISEAYAKFETQVLGPLEKWRQKATDAIKAKGENVMEKLLELDNRFLGITQSLTSWARGEHHRGPQIRSQQAVENKKAPEESTTLDTQNSNVVFASADPLRQEQQIAAEAARAALDSKGSSGLSLFEVRSQASKTAASPTPTAAENAPRKKPTTPKPIPPV